MGNGNLKLGNHEEALRWFNYEIQTFEDSNYAAMVANPEDLVRGQSSRGGSSVNGSNRAIEAYRSGGSPSASSAPATGSGSPD